MNHNSVNLAFGRREKNIWGYKKLQGGKKPIRKSEKKSGDLFFFLFFYETVKKLWGAAKKWAGGTKWQRYATGYDADFSTKQCSFH